MRSKRKERQKSSTLEQIEKRGRWLYEHGKFEDWGQNRYKIYNGSDSKKFPDVYLMDGIYRCTCPYHVHGRGRLCKHIEATKLFLKDKGVGDDEQEELPPEIIEKPVPTHKCGSTNCTPRDKVKRKFCKLQRYLCLDCYKVFVFNPGFKYRWYPRRIIVAALKKMARGTSAWEAAMDITNPDYTHPSESTLERWKKDYAYLLKSFGDKVVAPRAWYSLCGDEKYFTVNGWEAWLFTVMCMYSRYIIAWEPGEDKKTYDATFLLLRVILLMCKEPRDITIDKLNGWVKGVKNSLPNTIHRLDAAINKVHMNNNKHERFNGSLDTRFMLARGFGRMDSTTQDLFITCRNLIQSHMGINNLTPAEKLGVIIRVDEEDKIETITMHAALFCT